MPDIRQFVLDRLQEEYSLPGDIDLDTFNYIEAGYIDSMGIIRFTVEIEDAFGITFSDEEITSPSFQTIGTLIDMIGRKVEQ